MKRVTIIKPKTRYARHSISVEPVPLKNAMLLKTTPYGESVNTVSGRFEVDLTFYRCTGVITYVGCRENTKNVCKLRGSGKRFKLR